MSVQLRVLSSIRCEKAHSLSYQASTFTILPMTLVWVASNTQLVESWLKSIDTRGASMNLITPGGYSPNAFLTAPLIPITEVLLEVTKLRSSSETLMVGTRTASPSSFPSSSGSIFPIAAAAPEVVGIMD